MLLDILTGVRPETVEQFARAWHGAPRAPVTASDAPADVPGPLRRLYDVASAWPDLIVQNSLLQPPQRVGERITFYVENQGACSWMTTSGDRDDGPVWAEVDDGAIVTEGEPLSRFLVTVVILEAVFGAPDGASAAWVHRDRFSDSLGLVRLATRARTRAEISGLVDSGRSGRAGVPRRH